MGTLLLHFVLMGLTSCAYAETCPPEKNVGPCSCDAKDNGDILVTCVLSDSEWTLEGLKKILNSLSGKINIDLFLEGIREGSVPSDFFYGMGLKRLRIVQSTVHRFSEDDRPILNGLENALEELVLCGSLVEENVPIKLPVGHLKRLKDLEVSTNNLNELSDEWFDGGPASLEYLKISDNFIQTVGSRAFANLVNLRRLILADNRFGAGKRSMFPNPAQRLQLLNLDNNALTNIPVDLFSNMPVLNVVSLRENGIFRLDQKTWQPVWRQLDIIHLESNTIECDTHMKWIFSLRMTSAIYGTCGHPEDLKGETLQHFIDLKRIHPYGF